LVKADPIVVFGAAVVALISAMDRNLCVSIGAGLFWLVVALNSLSTK
jgi:hypothetical protein